MQISLESGECDDEPASDNPTICSECDCIEDKTYFHSNSDKLCPGCSLEWVTPSNNSLQPRQGGGRDGPFALMYRHNIYPSCKLFMFAYRNGAAKCWKERLEQAQKGKLQNIQTVNNFPMQKKQQFSREEREMLMQSGSESESVEELEKQLLKSRISRARRRRQTESEEGNSAIKHYLDRIIEKKQINKCAIDKI